jgi:elongation factor G
MEKELLHSLDASITSFEAHGKHVNLIDTPGYPDFLGRSISVLPAVETAAIVINAQSGIEPMTLRMMKAADNRNLCRMIIVSQIDAPDVDLAQLTDQIRETFGPNACRSICLPTAANGSSTASSSRAARVPTSPRSPRPTAGSSIRWSRSTRP